MHIRTATRRSALVLSLVMASTTVVAVGCSSNDGPGAANEAPSRPEGDETSIAVQEKVATAVLDVLKSEDRTRVIVTLRNQGDTSAAARGIEKLGEALPIEAIRNQVLSKVASLGNAIHVSRTWKHIPGFAADLDASALRALAADPNVERVDIDGRMQANLAQSLPLVKADKAHAAGYKGKGQKVVVIDTGVASNHPMLKGKVVDEACFCVDQGNGCCPNGQETQSGPGASADDQGHGSHVSGIVAGVAPEASLVGVKVLSARGWGDDSSIISALDWALEHHPDAAAINMSLGDPSQQYATDCDSSHRSYATVIDNLRAKGVITVAASGNEASSTGISAPSCVGNAFSVGAVYDANLGTLRWQNCTDRTTAADKITCFSNSAANLDILAPGAIITSANYQGGTTDMGGTSQATPHVAGAVAVVRGANTALAPADIEGILKTTGVAIRDSRNNVTRSRINVEAAANEAVRRRSAP
ncbi:S8 family peptidase [Pendulispora albinea]|uniref:S8 family serine peptidase n=1 Tax=Pendulispora albinea TaxID=2741071 RepID=A0ABZ2M8H3_9BACT